MNKLIIFLLLLSGCSTIFKNEYNTCQDICGDDNVSHFTLNNFDDHEQIICHCKK